MSGARSPAVKPSKGGPHRPEGFPWKRSFAMAPTRVLRLEEISRHQGPAPAWHGTLSRYVCPYEVAGVYAQLGDKDQAFEWLDKAYQSRSCLYWLRQDPRLASLHADPRFQALLTKMRFPQ